jgi:competence protein ComEA
MRPTRSRHPGLVLAVVLLAAGWLAVGAVAVRRPVPLDRAGGGVSKATWPDMRVNVCTAPRDELTLLPGVGPVLAARIVEDRQARGPYAGLGQLQRVHGIGPATVRRIGPFAVADPAGRENQ